MHRLSYGFVLGYHGCDRSVGEDLLRGAEFRNSMNDYDWLGAGIYFWEANPPRGLEYAQEAMHRSGSRIIEPFVVGAVIDLGRCLDLTTSLGIGLVQRAHRTLRTLHEQSGVPLPANNKDGLRRSLDRAVIETVHEVLAASKAPQSFDSVRGVFIEGKPAYEGAGFHEKTHVQIAVRNADCIKGVFRVPNHHLAG